MSKEADKLNNEILILKSIVKDQDQKIADLEAKLAQAQKTIEIQKMSNDALIDENLDYRYDITDTAYELAKGIAEDWELGYKDEIAELKQQLRQKEADIGFLEATTCSMQEDIDYWEKQFEEMERSKLAWENKYCKLEQQLAEKEKEIAEYKRVCTIAHVEDLQIENMLLKGKDQNKIKFAVEQLEQLKHDIWTDQQDDGWLDEQVDIYFLTETIENQIKKLTHQHEDKGE